MCKPDRAGCFCPDSKSSKRFSVCLGSKPGWFACWAFAGMGETANNAGTRLAQTSFLMLGYRSAPTKDAASP